MEENKEKKMSLQEWSMHYRQIIILLVSCFVAMGIYGLAHINKNEFPDFTIRQGLVIAVYPGVTVQDMEEQVTKPLEKYIFTYKEVKKEKTVSFTKDGIAIIRVELNDELTDKDAFWSKFKHGVQGFKHSLPEGVLAIQVNDDFGDTSALLLSMESEDKTYRELNDYMNQLIDSLRMIPSVGKMSVFGLQKDQVSIYINSDKLSHYGISYLLIAHQLKAKGFVTTAGRLKNDGNESPIYVDHALNKIYDVENTVIYTDASGNVVRLKDVATVKREYPKPKSFITNNGKKCLILSVEIKKGQDVSSMGAEIDKKLANIKQVLPEDVETTAITKSEAGGGRLHQQLPARADDCHRHGDSRCGAHHAHACGHGGSGHDAHHHLRLAECLLPLRHRAQHRHAGGAHCDAGHDCRRFHRDYRLLHGDDGRR